MLVSDAALSTCSRKFTANCRDSTLAVSCLSFPGFPYLLRAHLGLEVFSVLLEVLEREQRHGGGLVEHGGLVALQVRRLGVRASLDLVRDSPARRRTASAARGPLCPRPLRGERRYRWRCLRRGGAFPGTARPARPSPLLVSPLRQEDLLRGARER